MALSISTLTFLLMIGLPMSQAFSQSSPIDETSLGEFWSLWQAAFESPATESKLEAICQREFWKADGMSGQRFFEQAVRKKFGFLSTAVEVRKDRAVITVDLSRDDRVVDTVYLYLYRREGKPGWLWAGLDEVDGHVPRFLAGQLPATFTADDCVESAELQKLGKQLIESRKRLPQSTNTAETGRSLSKIGVDPEQVFLGRWLELDRDALSIRATIWSESIMRGAIEFHDGNRSQFLYVEKREPGWRLIGCSGGWLSMEDLLR